ncbi:Alpha/beta hydrolase family protein [Marinomonas spartinae]|uniref:Alpha/beta hydrolase family protein n=1 Tax=Marinomonas spartinae TaxID=1792290 RepID=A0A1A8TM15_9GAMM|nr:alpha/beta hydrolase [Marinomonas spartinae]SBS33876.1 Alpha/beta hydrolase family protein [Marinomonas spartinae]
MEATTLILNGNKYRYTIYKNETSDQYGIFLMGALQEIESVDFFSKYFSSTLNCITVELPGTGMTDVLPASVSILKQTEMLVDLIMFLKIEKAHIFAFSYATAISVELYNIWDGVLSLSICGGIPGIPESGRRNTIEIIGHALTDKKRFAQEFIKSLTSNNESIPRGKVISRSAIQKVFRYTDIQIQSFCENTLRLLVHKPSFDVSKIKVPFLLCIGEHDPYVKKKGAIAFSQKIPNSKFISIKNADHLVHIQHPEKTAKAMLANAYAMESSKKYIDELFLQTDPF